MLADMFRLETHSDQATGQIFETWDVGDDSKHQGWADWTGVLENAIQDPMSEDLNGLRPPNRLFPILLYPLEVMCRERIGA